MLDRGGNEAERSIGLNRKRGDAAAAVIRHENALARFVHGEVAGALSAGSLLVQEGQLSRRDVDGGCADGPIGCAC
jgi:hypothetical protein